MPGAGFPLNVRTEECLLDWNEILHGEPIPYEQTDSEPAVQQALSELIRTYDFFYVELDSDMPVVKVPARTFLEN